MKHIYSLLAIALVLSSCGSEKKQSVEDVIATNNLELIHQKKAELETIEQELAGQLKLLETKIKEIDPLEKIPLITTFEAKHSVFQHYVELQGNVDTKQNIVIYPEYSGVLSNVYVKEGQRVTKGQSLAKIDDGGLNQQLAQLKIQTALAKTTFERQERLWNQKIGSEIQYLQAKANYDAQEQAVGQLQQQLSKTIVRAPFSGTIDDVITEQGSVVSPGQSQLFRIVNLQDMYIETDVPERYITELAPGKDVKVDFPILNKQIDAKVRQAGNFINPSNRTFKVEIAIDNKDRSIKPNLTAKLKINDYTNNSAILIPQSIISENAEGKQYVYSISDKTDNQAKAKRVFIETGKTQGDYIEILSGLENGSEIINEGARSVKDGQSVKILNIE
ncbi:efflux RND transporter periplasmic adaptor subunit [Algibacter lectus]|uniref:Probable Co/Zn/Cd efflux system membrane fusion protein n=1 Tax=Algibacter lectus TaxID=221126 RepID=A0A090V7N8_9FLAO|nr:efflux RND transporter periplasmic adaptor subunit [Algibacter lectus]MWW24103.1 efflux RND transporter periplasmic adaptor subunit [Algibacter lectus]TDY62119.1 RND family efflux transporter MFP subunit [Algibacter lectus]SFC77013.1 RND family efflux transporter, MFP subunit [Algibacter lectus]GAL60885.1 probable Co/Zn/Cd efflux system membrane fusion protein [Algibacter lectus]GAL78783.1 probable Co/Zn/Cd efflux system membrane fusion protein [Algibacter lectus]